MGHALFRITLLCCFAALRFNLATQFVEANERKCVSVHIFESGENAAPNGITRVFLRRILTGSSAHRMPIILNAPQTWRIQKVNTAPNPFLELRGDIFGNESNVGRPANELRFPRARFRDSKDQQRGAVGRSDGHPTIALLKAGIERDIKAELRYVEIETLLVITHIDGDLLKTQVRPRA